MIVPSRSRVSAGTYGACRKRGVWTQPQMLSLEMEKRRARNPCPLTLGTQRTGEKPRRLSPRGYTLTIQAREITRKMSGSPRPTRFVTITLPQPPYSAPRTRLHSGPVGEFGRPGT